MDIDMVTGLRMRTRCGVCMWGLNGYGGGGEGGGGETLRCKYVRGHTEPGVQEKSSQRSQKSHALFALLSKALWFAN